MGHDKHYVLRFGEFELEMPQKNLSRDGVRLKLGGRASSLLAALAEAKGELVSQDQLLACVWPGQAIDDSTIRVHLSALRKVLGSAEDGNQLIVNEAGRGYRLSLTVSRIDYADEAERANGHDAGIRLPARIDVIIGRDHTIASLSEQLINRRFITVAGPGGIGKTTVGIATGRVVSQKVGATAFFVDFSPIGNGGLVPPTVAATVGLTTATSNLVDALITEFKGKSILLLLDNCEHVLEEVAALAENLLISIPDLMILCTSREPLGAQGEWIHRLAPLELPPEDMNVPVEELVGFPAITLFCERARSVRNDFVLGAENFTAIADICRRLDGMPLAIEFAAARMNVMTASAIADGLKERFDLLSKGRRTAMSRHKTLRATLDWSYELLSVTSRQVLNRLSVFRSTFNVSDVQAVAVGGDISATDIFDHLVDLVEKSMLIARSGDGEMRYRLLETTRQYALEKLMISGEGNTVRRKHAEHLISLFSDTKKAWEGKASRSHIDSRREYIDDIRAAIDWAVGEDGDISLGQQVLAASSSLWFYASLPGEFITHTRRFLSAIRYDGGCDRSFELLAAYGHALWHKEGPYDEMQNAFEKALLIAQRRNDHGLVLRAVWGIWAQKILVGKYDESLLTANEFVDSLTVEDGVANMATGLHMQALSSHFAGYHEEALALLERVIEADKAAVRADHRNHAQVDGKIAVLSLLMRIKWLTGAPEEAMELAKTCAADAFELDHTLSICYGLGVGCIPVAIANRKYDIARDWIMALRAETKAKGLDHWGNFADGYEAAIEGRCEIPDRASKMQREMFEVARRFSNGEDGVAADIKWFSHLAKAS